MLIDIIRQKVKESFIVHHLNIENESFRHNVPKNSETHFKIILISDDFVELNKVKRHQRIYSILKKELDSGVHALALHLYTIDEWDQKKSRDFASPSCMGGSGEK
jgi:BolA family transcriptional regulator, general stress-responsive regulator